MIYPWLCDENGKPLDDEQRSLAICDDAHMLINAGPGSGKTKVLVAHYLHLLMTNDWDIGAVVAITFTEKAAAEMKERICKVLQRIVHEGRKRWRERACQLLDRLPEAPIGTIHSFCARLLRQFAIEAKLDPSFQVLDDLQASILRQQVCEQWLQMGIAEPSSGENEAKSIAETIVAYYGYERAVKILTELLNLRPLIEHRKRNGMPILCQVNGLIDSEKALEQCYDQIVQAYDEAKREVNGLDFDDLLLRAWQLLQDKGVCERVRRQHRHILVDELQDTDRVQMEILRLICGWDEPDSHVKFFGVGDSQQSIYSFRNADVSVFNKLWEHAQGAHGWRAERLSVNYRSIEPLVDLTNRVFERIFVASDEDKSLQYIQSQLQKMRASRTEMPDEACIELTIFRLPSMSKWQRLCIEADWVAKRIGELASNGIRYGDIAILLRELVNASAYENALRRYGIPYHIIAGYGFFEAMEARDLLSFLQVIAEPDDEVAWMAWLRSPMIGVSDEALFWMGQENLGQLSQEEREKIEWAQRLRNEALQKADRVSMRELLEWILGETRYDVLVAALPQGKQRLANIRKFLRMAQEISDNLKLTVRGLVRYAMALMEGAERIGEPPLAGATTDAVQIMTIHAAKGLEFPVIIVPMLGEVSAPKGSGDVLVADPELGIAIRRYNEVGESLNRNEMPNFQAVDESRKMRERAESERLLFVAWTRAKDRLILVGTRESDEQESQGNPQTSDWKNWLQLVTDALQASIGQEQVKFAEFEVTDAMKAITRRQISASIQWLEGNQPIPELPSQTFELPSAQPSVVRLSVSDLITQPEGRYASGGDAKATMEVGSVVHALLRYGIFEPDNGQLLWVAQTVGADAEKILERANDLRMFVRRAINSSAWQEARQAQKRWHELDFCCRLMDASTNAPAIELVGRWDLIAKTQDGWLVVDFKTDAVSSPNDAKRKFDEVYRWQALAYAYAALCAFNAQKVRLIFIFVALDDGGEVESLFSANDLAKLRKELCDRAISLLSKQAISP